MTPPGEGLPLCVCMWGQRSAVTSHTKINQRVRSWFYLGAGEGTELPPSDQLDPAVLKEDPAVLREDPGPGFRLQAGGTAAPQWMGRPLVGSDESIPHQSLCTPEEHRLGQVH